MPPSVAQIVERVRSRYGVALEVMDEALQPVVPEAGGELLRALGGSAPARAAVAAAMQAGRGRTLEVADTSFLIQPLRAGRGSRRPAGVMGFRRPADGQPGFGSEAERWADFLRMAIEAELSSSEGLREERFQSRRAGATLRFLGQLAGMSAESEIAQAVAHAAAVWFDLDARLYRRDLAGELLLHTHLPGIPEAPPHPRLRVAIGEVASVHRSAADGEGLAWATPEALLIPMAVDGPADWVLVLGGLLPADAQQVFQTVADAAASHFARLAAARRADLRRRLDSIAAAPGAPERTVLELLREVMAETGAASGAVTLFEGAGSRRLAAVGSPLAASPSTAACVSPERLSWPMPLGPSDRAVLDLSPDGGQGFSPEAADLAREAVFVLRVLLLGHLRSEGEGGDAAGTAGGGSGFVERITQEVERAKRFDLGLSMLLIELAADDDDGDVLRALMASVRAELRGSDVLGVLGRGRIAALLVHTDALGVGAVVARVRRCLQQHAAERPALRLGRAVLSRDCATTVEFLAQASRNGETVAAA